MKMFLTRLGEDARMVVTGDLTPDRSAAAARAPACATRSTRSHGVEGIAMVRFTEADVVRHPLVARIVARL